MSGTDPLGGSDDPWSGFSPAAANEYESRAHYINADKANGGALASMHAPAPSQSTTPVPPSNGFLSERLPRAGSGFGSGSQPGKRALFTNETENAILAWNSPDPPQAEKPSKDAKKLTESQLSKIEQAASSSPSQDTPSANGDDQEDPDRTIQDPLQLSFHASTPPQPHQDLSIPTIGEATKEGQTDTNDVGNEAGDEEEDDEEAFVYPGASSTDQPDAPRSPSSLTEATPLPVEESRSTATLSASGSPPTHTNAEPSEPQPRSQLEAQPAAPTEASLPPPSPAPVNYERLAQLSSRGPLSELQKFIEETCSAPPTGAGVSAFALANEPNPATGLLPLHFAAKEGKLDIVKWLINEAGAIVELEDREGETPLHKAALSGKLPVLTFLLANGSDANAKDADGWTPLHNACSRGYLDIVRVLIDTANADIEAQGGRGKWTPLMNAASKGHLPIVRHLTAKHHADPFVRNASGETAFDVAAATFEIYICEVLERYEAERWNASKFSATNGNSAADEPGKIVPGRGPYNPLALHTTIPVLLHENQRLDTRLKTLAINGGKPRWSATSAARPHKPDRRSPSSMPPGPLAPSRTRHSPMRREDVNLPTRALPYKLRLRTRLTPAMQRRRAQAASGNASGQDDLASTPTPESILSSRRSSEARSAAGLDDENVESSHFWLSEWQPDLTHPLVNVDEGWQYAQSFDALDDRWSAEIPPPLSRLLDGGGLSASVTRALTGGGSLTGGQGDQEAAQTGWVRRRRWVRVMRRRLDIEFGDDLEAFELGGPVSAHADAPDALATGVDAEAAGGLSTAAIMAAQDAARSECAQLGPDADYVSRARALAGSSAASGSTPADALGQDKDEIARRIARLVMAITELRQAFEDQDSERRSGAEELRKEYTVQLGQLREAAGLDEDEDEDADVDDEEEFIYPNSYKDDGASVMTRLPAAIINPTTPGPSTSATSRPVIPERQGSISSGPRSGEALGAARSADLAANRDFRVPTNEAPNKVSYGRGPVLREQHLQPQWERDEDAPDCRGCARRFTFFLRKHHCRRCGKIYCDACSSHRAQLSVQELVVDPSLPGMALNEAAGPARICSNCHAERQLPPSLQSARGADALMPLHANLSQARATDDHTSMNLAPPSDVSSRASELNECPVCNKTLASFGEQEAQEEHVRNCLENGGGGSLQGGRYLVYKLPENSPIVGKECLICMEDFVANNMIARLPCLCYFHRGCIDSWFKRGRECPVHARTW